jgi:hypothetical protein
MSMVIQTVSQSAPPAFEDALAFPFPDTYYTTVDSYEGLKQQYINKCSLHCNGKSFAAFGQSWTNSKPDQQWMQHICGDQTSFLSHVSLSSVYQDLADGLLHDSSTTISAKTNVLGMLAGRLEANDATILSILHLLLSEAGDNDDSAFKVHYRGLQSLICRRGGVGQLPDRLAVYINL